MGERIIKTIFIKDINEVNKKQLFCVYHEGIKHNASTNTHFELEAHTWQTNIASIKSHQAVGFEIDKNYVVRDDGSKDDFGVTLIMKK